MQRQVRGWVALVMALGCFGPAIGAVAQTDDDWEFAADAPHQVTVAVVRYDGGKSIVARCSGEELKVIIVGLPATTEAIRRFDASRADGAKDSQVWQTGEGQVLTSAMPARDARFLRVGGELRLHSAAGQASSLTTSFDLPTQHANLDRVLTACGYALEDERDALPRAAPDFRLARKPSEGSTGGRPGRSLEVSCIIQAGAYRECRADHLLKGQRQQAAQREANALNGLRLHPDDAAANEGRVAYTYIPLLRVVSG